MALLAWRRGVQANQWKARQVMIEENPFAPPLFIVAPGAILSFVPLVYVVVSVAIDTIGSKVFTLGFRALVATLANDFRVLSFQGELRRLVVVEGGLAPVGCCMTSGAILPRRPFMLVGQLVA